MLFNPTKLQGIAPKIQKLAVRELQISARHEDSLSRGSQPSMPPAGPGPMQPGALPNGTRSGTSSEEPSPAKRAPSMLPDIKEAPIVDIVPGVRRSQVDPWIHSAALHIQVAYVVLDYSMCVLEA